MDGQFDIIQRLIQERADYQARLNLIPYDGSPEVKENSSGKYLYVRKRVNGRLTSTYVDIYSDDLYQLLLRNTKEARNLKKQIRRIDKELAANGYIGDELSPEVITNLEFARANMKSNIYDQAVLEGVATSFPQTEEIIENGTVNGMTADDVQKILNLKHAWEFILDKDVIRADSDYYLLCHIAKLVNEGFFHDGQAVAAAVRRYSHIHEFPCDNPAESGCVVTDKKFRSHIFTDIFRAPVFREPYVVYFVFCESAVILSIAQSNVSVVIIEPQYGHSAVWLIFTCAPQ